MKKAVENAKSSKVLLINADELLLRARRKSSEEELIHRNPSSFITRRKFVSKLERAKSNQGKEPALEILQPGINRPSVIFESTSKMSWGVGNNSEDSRVVKFSGKSS